MPTALPPPVEGETESVLDELSEMRDTLLSIIDRITTLESAIQNAPVAATRPEVEVPIGIFDDWESVRVFVY
jgi:hypothetical protein